MRTTSAPAIILDVIDLQEKDRIVSFLTPENGKKRGVARSARTKYSRFAGQLQLLSKVEISWFEKAGQDLVRIQDVQLLRPAAALQEDLEGILLASYLAEHMTEFVLEEDPSNAWFRLLDSTLEALLGGVDRFLAIRYFEVWVLRLSGILPVPRQCPLCDEPLSGAAALLESEGAVICRSCAADQRSSELSADAVEFLRRTGRENLASLAAQPPVRRSLVRVEDICRRVRRHFLQGELKSYGVMRGILSE